MTVVEFYRKYAGLKISKRFIILDSAISELDSMSAVYRQIDALEEKIMLLKLKQNKLLKVAEKGFRDLN